MVRKFLGLLIVALFVWINNGFAASEDVYLLPARPGEKSEVVPLHKVLRTSPPPNVMSAPPPVDQVLQHDDGSMASFLGGLLAGDTLVNFFQSPASCTLLAIQIATFPFFQMSGINFDAFAADPADSIDFFNDYEEYHGAGSMPGPSPIESILQAPTTLFSDTADPWDTLTVTGMPDVGTNYFVGGYIMPDSTPNPFIDAGVSAPYYALIWRPDPASGVPGWYSSWHLFYVRALVRMYENPPPVVVTFDRLSDSYLLSARTVNASFTDFGIPLDSSGVELAELTYMVNGGGPTVLTMNMVSGDSSNGTWSVAIPGQSVGDTVCYTVQATDYQGAMVASSSQCYVTRAGTPNQCVLFVSEEIYPGSGNFDVIDSVLAAYDYWDADAWGPPDASVLNFGYTQIVWFTFSGFAFADDSLLIANYLDNGGNLFISSVDLIGGGLGYGFGSYTTSPGDFAQDYLHILSGTDDFVSADTGVDVFGLPSDPITDPWSATPAFVWPYSFAPGNNWSGEFTTDGTVDDIFFYLSGETSGYKFEGMVGGASHRLVYFYWPMAYIEVPGSPDTPDITAQVDLASRVITWLGCTTVVGVEEGGEKPGLPSVYSLNQNSPNPVGSRAEIRFGLPLNSQVSLKVYDITGSLVKELLQGELKAGDYTITWDMREGGSRVASGIYFYRLTAGDFSATRKMVVLR
ncbi:T9SS type A sorting domain-containing protein [candidate division TA06 bacterium]|nr:T9SS type A sorting domain-containing protein [candidate division TA06 bacterium]